MSSHARTVPLFAPQNVKIHWSEVHCKGDESDLLQCPKITWNGGERESTLVAAVTCTQQQGCPTLLGMFFMNMKSDFK